MTEEMVRAAARKLVGLHQRVAHCFGRREAQAHSLVYLRGLMSNEKRKSVEPIALQFAQSPDGEPATQKEVVALQRFVSQSPWEAAEVYREIQAIFAEDLMPSAAQSPLGTVGVVDESGFVKKGSQSVGVARQWCGRLGKVENCQVGVLLVGVTPAGSALLDSQVFLPEAWVADAERREQAGVPEEVQFASKPQIAAEMLRRTVAAGKVQFDWITADDLYGRSGPFLDVLEGLKLRYLVDVPCDTTVWTSDPAISSADVVRSVSQIESDLPASAWWKQSLGEGAKGPKVYRFAVRRVWAVRHGRPGPAVWLVIRRALDSREDVKYCISNADAQTDRLLLGQATGERHRVEDYLHDGKGLLGMADYEMRSWTGWHHHMSLVSLAHLFVTLTQRDLQQDEPELTLPMAVELLKSAFSRPRLDETNAIRLIEYHLRRNRTARQSHRKSWLRKHKNVKPKVFL